MTAAQKKVAANFKKALAIRKATGCSLKDAFAKVYGKKTTAVKKSASKKKVAHKKSAPKKKVGAIKKKSTPKKKIVSKKKAVKKPTYKLVTKKVARKKAAPKKSTSLHKDTKSHNVNIKVMSGINHQVVDAYKRTQSSIDTYKKVIEDFKHKLLNEKNPKEKAMWRKAIKIQKLILKEHILHCKELKKHM